LFLGRIPDLLPSLLPGDLLLPVPGIMVLMMVFMVFDNVLVVFVVLVIVNQAIAQSQSHLP